MTCERVRGRLSEWLDGDLEPGAARSVSSHLQSCEECARTADELRAVSSLLAALPRLEARESVAARVNELGLSADTRREKEHLAEVTAYTTALAMNYVTRGKFVQP